MNRYLAVCATSAIIIVCSLPADAISISVGTSFTGSTSNQVTGPDPLGLPPDISGAVGSDHIVELLNGRYAVYDKTNGQLLQSDSLAGFWESARQSPIDYAFDPHVIYDSSSQRWFATSVERPLDPPPKLMVAVSNSADPTQGWTGFRIDNDPTNQTYADFPKLGIDAEGVYATVVNRSRRPDPNKYVSTTLAVLPKADLISPTPNIDNATLLRRDLDTFIGFQPRPVVNLDATAGPVPMLSGNEAQIGSLVASRISGPLAAPVIENAELIPVDPVPPLAPAPQPGPKPDIKEGGSGVSTFTADIVLRNGSIWAAQSEMVDGRSGVRWYEIDADSFAVLQTGKISDENLYLYDPSIAVNDRGHVVIGFSGSSESQYVSAYAVAGETIGGTTVFGDLLLLQEGLSDYFKPRSNGENGWGDYSTTVVDPDDPLAFWTFQGYVDDTDVWGVSINQVLVPEPGTALLVGLGLIGIGAQRCRARAA